MRLLNRPPAGAGGSKARAVSAVAGLSLVCLALGSSPAWAIDRATSDRLKDIEGEATGLSSEVDAIRVNFTERSGLIGATEARQRYEDAVYLYLVKDYEQAATSFYIIVQSRALGNEDLARDSEWYLAECLFEMGNYRTAEEAYRAIIDRGPSHPYFTDAVRRILEVYGIIGDVQGFDSAYNTWIVSGKVQPTELINYTLAKSFYRRGEFARAKAMFESLPAASPYYTRARYFLGVLMIREKNYPQAITEYKTVLAAPVTDDEHKQVAELATLALARLYYETGDFASASAAYEKIGHDSPYYADQLYESVWTFIKQEKWLDAQHQVEVFLLAFPEHRYTASLKLLQGHLNMKTETYDIAQTSYEGVVSEYTPLVGRIDGVANGGAELQSFLDGMSGGATMASAKLPQYAVEMLIGRDDVSRATNAWKSMAAQQQTVAENARVIKDLEVALSGNTNVLGTFVAARTRLTGIRSNVVSLRDRLLDAESAWLKSRVSPAGRTELADMQKERSTALATAGATTTNADSAADKLQIYDEQVRMVQNEAFRLSQVLDKAKADADATTEQLGQTTVPQADAESIRKQLQDQLAEIADIRRQLDQAQSEVVRRRILRGVEAGPTDDGGQRRAQLARQDELRQRLAALRRTVTDPEAAAVYGQLDAAWAQVDRIEASSGETAGIIASSEKREMDAVRARLEAEKQRHAQLVAAVDTEKAESGALATRVVRFGLHDLEGQFQEDVLEADKGIVDTYWLRKSGTSDEMEFLVKEQTRLLNDLDEQYRMIRENLDR